MTFNNERICGIVLIIIFGVIAFYFQKGYFYQKNNPLNGFSITKSKYQNLLFSWVLAGVAVSVYLLAGFFEAQFTIYWNFEITPIIILATGFILGPFYGLLVAVIGNISGLLLTPGVTGGSIQFLLTWIRGLVAFCPLVTMAIYFRKKRKNVINVLFMLVVLYFVVALWTTNLVIILKPSIVHLAPSGKKIAIAAMVGTTLISLLVLSGIALQYRRLQVMNLQRAKIQSNHVIANKKRSSQSSMLQNKTENIRLWKSTKKSDFESTHWKQSVGWLSILSMTIFYIFVYYLFGGLIVGRQILHISYWSYILFKTPSWLLSWSCGIIILYYFLIVVSQFKKYDFVIIKIKKRVFN